jgi:hypothetical protein
MQVINLGKDRAALASDIIGGEFRSGMEYGIVEGMKRRERERMQQRSYEFMAAIRNAGSRENALKIASDPQYADVFQDIQDNITAGRVIDEMYPAPKLSQGFRITVGEDGSDIIEDVGEVDPVNRPSNIVTKGELDAYKTIQGIRLKQEADRRAADEEARKIEAEKRAIEAEKRAAEKHPLQIRKLERQAEGTTDGDFTTPSRGVPTQEAISFAESKVGQFDPTTPEGLGYIRRATAAKKSVDDTKGDVARFYGLRLNPDTGVLETFIPGGQTDGYEADRFALHQELQESLIFDGMPEGRAIRSARRAVMYMYPRKDKPNNIKPVSIVPRDAMDPESEFTPGELYEVNDRIYIFSGRIGNENMFTPVEVF